MRLIRATVWLSLACLAAACGDDPADHGEPAAETGIDARLRPDTGYQDLDESADTQEPVDLDDAADAVESGDLALDPDAADRPDQVEEPAEVSSDLEEEEIIPTDDCEPLTIPQRWVGTFEGDIESNIPDFGGYTFQGPVSGEMRLEIWCIDRKLVVTGELDGGSTNCVLENGCPFTARLEGFYDPESEHIEGEMLDGVIDYSMVQVYAEGEFEGDLAAGGQRLSGVWSGEKTGISTPTLDWVVASGVGTWEATPEIP
ncbi:MAG: hypothetical protein JW797_14555 [Bradymonadales bacterium]|nr:hypothetical protein [Bradymonadales bacterium]